MKENNLYQHDLECEKCVLGVLLSERNAVAQVREILSADSFYLPLHRKIYSAILSITDKGDRADMITVMPEIKKAGGECDPFDIAQIASCYTFDIVQYACRLADLEKLRKIQDLGSFLVSGASKGDDVGDILDYAKSQLDSIYGNINHHIRTANDFLNEVCNRVSDNLNGVTVQGTPTGFNYIDDKGGLQPTDLIIVAAASSQGKTAFSNAITLNACKLGTKIAFYSMEMTGRQLMTRFAAMDSGIPSLRLANERLSDTELRSFDKSVQNLSQLQIFFDDRSNSSIEAIIASIRSMVIKQGVQGAIIDYLQLVVRGSKTMNEEAALADAARRLKNLAKELNIWIIALSQLNRDLNNPVPSIDRLRGSGQINEASDLTILLYRAEVYNKRFPHPFDTTDPKGTVLVDIAKGRNVGVGKFIAGFDARTTLFYDLKERPILPYQAADSEPF